MQLVGQRQNLLHRAAEAIELPHRENVAAAQVLQGCGQSRTVGLAAGDLVLEELHGTRFGQRVTLKLGVLTGAVADSREPNRNEFDVCVPAVMLIGFPA